jgi:creatinine amidohydrolase/Fe(II)-dependent formamide hydrolase-like protein
LCDRAANAAAAEDLEVLIAPTLNVTLSWYHMQFPGSLRLKADTFLHVFEEVCESLHHHGLALCVAGARVQRR